jgi:transcription-repair coupling factor (superfamily II helicase)
MDKSVARHIQVQGLSGSLGSVVAATAIKQTKGLHVFVLSDKDEAGYFVNDLEALESSIKPLLFPTSYKKAYQYEEVDNANVLQRAEVLSYLNQLQRSGKLDAVIVTYPEALSEKVLNKKDLRQNTISIAKGDTINLTKLNEQLQNLGFEKTDFVLEPGQYAIRGFILDIFSYAKDLPVRIELFGNEVESLRSFNPENQLSVQDIDALEVVPNIQTKLQLATRESFFQYLPSEACIWFRHFDYTLEVLDTIYQRVEETFESIIASVGGKGIISEPAQIFDNAKVFMKTLATHRIIEFGYKKSQKLKAPDAKVQYESAVQMAFNKDYQILSAKLSEFAHAGYEIVICSDSPKQLERLHYIFEEINQEVHFKPMYISLTAGFEDKQNKLICYTDHQIFERFHRYKEKERFTKSKGLTLKELKTLMPGDYVVHIDYGIGRFAGLQKVEVNGKQQEAVRLVYRDNDFLFVSIHSLHKISKYSGKDGEAPTISKLGSEEWENKKKKVKKRVKDIAKDLIKLYAKRKAAKGFAFSKDNFLMAELESNFMYEETPDQAKAINAVKDDMEKQHPMDRLVCGDVGFGKTEVAVRAAFKAVCDSKQVAVLVPTTILAMQHYKTFKERLSNLPCNVDYINRFKSSAEIKNTLKKLQEGKTDILIGTHRLLSKDVQFKNIGLLIVDEEQKFGVKSKEKLKEIKVNVDSLTLTATPIPRTLQFSLLGARDLSIIATPPPNRQPVTTEVRNFDEAFIRDAVRYELQRGGQVFFVHNRIADIFELANMVLKLVPDAKVGVAHGQMEAEKLENAMIKFIEGEYDVLVSTNIIESGLDIPNANTIIINRAHTFGLSDLHQMRGRVGRSNRKAYCYLLTPHISHLPADSRKRLNVLEEFSDLGDGFKVAMRDLDIRGAGDLLGAEQSGFISDVGFDTYHKILDEAIQELKEHEFKELFADDLSRLPIKRELTIETDLEILIPDTYINSISERLHIYTRADDIKTEEELEKLRSELKDRFGPLPHQVESLLESVRLRWLGLEFYMERIVLKNQALTCYFATHENQTFFQSAKFGAVIDFVREHPHLCQLKEAKSKLLLKVSPVNGINEAFELLQKISLLATVNG